MDRPEIEAMLIKAIDFESEIGLPWGPSSELAQIVYRRWCSFARRCKSKTPSRDDQIRDLAKGIKARVDPSGLFLPPGDALDLARILAGILEKAAADHQRE